MGIKHCIHHETNPTIRGNNTTNTALGATEKCKYVAKIKTDKLLKAGHKKNYFCFWPENFKICGRGRSDPELRSRNSMSSSHHAAPSIY